ncbi:hypothetical protein ILUMI_24179 [Ignelater luminosus]|uniref:Peptidase S1 domain-containing protein n=1 Tax=Ignelater luminosus TaxID=2038154 RepID=A0A8K0G154_IGNLU|nr:hypothetical protein ILUMI_24179 [Ignelater luminosus]
MFQKTFPLFFIFLYFCNISLAEEIKPKLLPDKDVCGKQEQQRIFGGEEAGIGEFSWLALLKSKSYGFVCGGALINKRYVLTAGHCIIDDLVSVRLGEHNIATEEDCEGDTPGLENCADAPVDIDIEDIIVHEDYSSSLFADITLLRLKEEVNYTDYIKPVCLPLSDELRNKAFTGENVIVAGWGKTKTKIQNNAKLKVELPVISNNDCAKFYAQGGITITGSQMCAGGEKGKDSCQGDSGGPVMYLDRSADEENWMTIGVVSFGLQKCGIESQPGVYTRVTDYIPWILDNIQP